MGDIEPRDIQRVWREKSDEELIEAAAQLNDYTPAGQRVIRDELKRRDLEDPVEQAGDAAANADPGSVPARACAHCHAESRYVGIREFSTEVGPMRELRQVFQDQPLDVYVCPQCGHVDLFVTMAEAEEEQEEEEVPEDAEQA